MELYIGEDLISERAKVADLENALAAVKALNGKKDLCLQAHEDGPQLILDILAGPPTGFCVDHIDGEECRMTLSTDWKQAADCMRRFLAGRPPFPNDTPEDDCPLCKARL